MKCEFCQKEFKSTSSLNNHQRTAKYCLKIRNVGPSESFKCLGCELVSTHRKSHEKHLVTCKAALYRIGKEESEREAAAMMLEKDNQLDETHRQLDETRRQLDETRRQLDEKERKIIELESRILSYREMNIELESNVRIYKEMNDRDRAYIESLGERPTTTNMTNNFNCPPLTQEHFEENAQFLSLDHIKKGFQGYAQYALDYPLKGRLKCTDYSRRKVKYKNEEGEVVVDPEMKQVRTRLFNALLTILELTQFWHFDVQCFIIKDISLDRF